MNNKEELLSSNLKPIDILINKFGHLPSASEVTAQNETMIDFITASYNKLNTCKSKHIIPNETEIFLPSIRSLPYDLGSFTTERFVGHRHSSGRYLQGQISFLLNHLEKTDVQLPLVYVEMNDRDYVSKNLISEEPTFFLKLGLPINAANISEIPSIPVRNVNPLSHLMALKNDFGNHLHITTMTGQSVVRPIPDDKILQTPGVYWVHPDKGLVFTGAIKTFF